MLRVLMIMCLALTLCACGSGDDKAGGPTKAGPPTQADVIARLYSFEAAARGGDLEGALAHLVPFGGVTTAAIPKLVKTEGITAEAIAKLAGKGTFGPLSEVYPERGAYFAKKAGVKLEECYAINADPAEIAVHWNGSELRFIRLDDLHKLK